MLKLVPGSLFYSYLQMLCHLPFTSLSVTFYSCWIIELVKADLSPIECFRGGGKGSPFSYTSTFCGLLSLLSFRCGLEQKRQCFAEN